MQKVRTYTKQAGQTLVEVLVAMGLLGILLPALATGLMASREGKVQELQRLEATGMLREMDEAVRSVREKGWTAFATNGTYHPTITGNAWALIAGSQLSDGYTKQVIISDVRRDSNGAIVQTGGTIDSSTKKVTTSVSWQTPFQQSVSSEAYITRHIDHTAWTQTAQADFTAGTLTNTSVTNTAGGEVQLAQQLGGPTWGTLSVAGSYNTAATLNVTQAVVDGTYLYVTAGNVLYILNIANPVAPSLVGSFTTTTGVVLNDIFVVGNYAYLATSSDTAEFLVVNITNKAAPTSAAMLNLGDTADGRSIFVDTTNNYAYLGKNNSTGTGANELNIINVATPTSPTLAGSLNFAANVTGLVASGNYVYASTSSDTQELAVFNVTTKTAPSLAGAYNAAGTADANRVAISGTRAFIVLNNNTSGGEFFAINITTPTAPALLGSFETGANTAGVDIVDNNAFLVGARTSKQLTIVNITTLSAMAERSAINLTTTTAAVAVSNDYAFVGSTEDTREVAVVKSGTYSSGVYQTSGSFESHSFDAGASVALTNLTLAATEPANTEVRLQIATNNDNSTWNFLGPDGTAGSYYTTAAPIPINTLGRYVRFKAFLTGTTSATPILQRVTLGYTP